ncbi:UNVERIFIED_CONTAM: hypothetical protein GTU68_042937, partial [Idotea baltica]|nr:hypothetical protein [Idotea baltica]
NFLLQDLLLLSFVLKVFYSHCRLGVLGTEGRLCNRTSWGMDGCPLLCCGRGYQTMLQTVEKKCKCRFVWCCKVVCDMCRLQQEEHYCN